MISLVMWSRTNDRFGTENKLEGRDAIPTVRVRNLRSQHERPSLPSLVLCDLYGIEPMNIMFFHGGNIGSIINKIVDDRR